MSIILKGKRKGKLAIACLLHSFLQASPLLLSICQNKVKKKKKPDSQSFSANCESIKNTYKKDKNHLFCGVTKLPLHSEINLSDSHGSVVHVLSFTL